MHASRFYRPELDVLRFFCFLLVFFHHLDPSFNIPWMVAVTRAGSFGVPVFFLLSSFLITELLLQERATTGRVHMGAFYARRILRIWPLYFAFFGVCWLAGHLHHLAPIPGGMAASFFLLSGNWYFTRMAGGFASPAGILWSISIEEQFYLLWPWLVRAGGRRAVLLGSACLIPLSYVAIYWLAARGVRPDPGIWANTLAHVQFFAAGGLLALLLRGRSVSFGWPARVGFLLLTASAWFVSTYCCGVKDLTPHIPPLHACAGYLLMAIGAVAFFFAFYGLPLGQGRWTRLLEYLGKISYGLYVFHYLMLYAGEGIATRLLPRTVSAPLYLACAGAFAFALTVLFAYRSYEWFERPFLRWKQRFTFIRSRAA
jgi:peptidoglycan/LPS O-acetylase OafA/YrhL